MWITSGETCIGIYRMVSIRKTGKQSRPGMGSAAPAIHNPQRMTAADNQILVIKNQLGREPVHAPFAAARCEGIDDHDLDLLRPGKTTSVTCAELVIP